MHAGRVLLVALLAVGAVTNPAAGEQGQRAQPRAFVSNCLFAVDAHTFKVTTVTQRMGRRPWGVAVTPDGKRIYTANGRSDDVSVIDATALKVVHTIANVGRGPHSIVISR